MAWKGISDAVIRRLPIYLRVLEEVKGKETCISSHELGKRAGVRPALVRKDLAWFGEFGKQGVGYDVEFLQDELRKILNLDEPLHMALVGVGSLGHALARYNWRRFQEDPLFTIKLVALFDIRPELIGGYRWCAHHSIDEIPRWYGETLEWPLLQFRPMLRKRPQMPWNFRQGYTNFAPVKLDVLKMCRWPMPT